MADRTEAHIECDGCSAAGYGDDYWSTVADLRHLLAEAGWRSDAANDSDLCPTCVCLVDEFGVMPDRP